MSDLKSSRALRACASGRSWATEVCPGWLFLGNASDAQNLALLREHRVSHILNVADDVPNFFENSREFHYLKLSVQDCGQDEGISRVFQAAFEYVAEVMRKNGKVLVHCAAGLNRSVTVTIALKMQLEGLSLREAFAELKQKRAQIAPFRDNRAELIRFEKQLLGKNSLSTEEFSRLVGSRAASSPPYPSCSPASSPSSSPAPSLTASSCSLSTSSDKGREQLTCSLPNIRPKSTFSFPVLCPVPSKTSSSSSSCFPPISTSSPSSSRKSSPPTSSPFSFPSCFDSCPGTLPSYFDPAFEAEPDACTSFDDSYLVSSPSYMDLEDAETSTPITSQF